MYEMGHGLDFRAPFFPKCRQRFPHLTPTKRLTLTTLDLPSLQKVANEQESIQQDELPEGLEGIWPEKLSSKRKTQSESQYWTSPIERNWNSLPLGNQCPFRIKALSKTWKSDSRRSLTLGLVEVEALRTNTLAATEKGETRRIISASLRITRSFDDVTHWTSMSPSPICSRES